jgi:nitrogen fixation protein
MELIQMTAAYSNAVLMAVLPHVTDVAKNLDLPVLRPVQAAHVEHFVCDPRKGAIGGWVTLTNGYKFWFNDGHVDMMESPNCYFHLQNPDEIPRFYGTRRMTEGEAVEIARQTVRKLGYSPSWLKTDKPKVEEPRTATQDQPKVVPRFRVTWQRIALDSRKTIAEIEINTDAKRCEMFWLLGREFERKPPDIPQPPVIAEPPAPAPPVRQSKLNLLPESQRVAATNEVCAQSTDMAKRLDLPVKLPIRPSDIKESTLDIQDGGLIGAIVLKNGYRFVYQHGYISSFYSRNSDAYQHGIDLSTVNGKVRYTKPQILDYATKQVRRLGYPDNAVFLDQPAFVGGGPDENNPGYTRFRVSWQIPGTKGLQEDRNAQFVEAEINGMTLQLESLWLRSTNLYKPSILKQ